MANDSVTLFLEGNEIRVDDPDEHVARRKRMDWIVQLEPGDDVVIEFEQQNVEEDDLVGMSENDDEPDSIVNDRLKGPFRMKKGNPTENPERGKYHFEATAKEEKRFKTGRASVCRGGIWPFNKWKYTVVWKRGKGTWTLDPHVSVKR